MGQPEYKSVLFVEQTVGGELAKRLRELLHRLAPVMGFAVKVVERMGATLQSRFPQSGIWEGTQCGRNTCITCNQGAEQIEQCTKRSAVYENVCGLCDEGAGGKGAAKGGSNPDIPSVYVGETSRTIQERALEHWAAAKGSRKAREGSHIHKHMEQHHRGEQPKFYLKVAGFYRSALARQMAEAVRIRRRGGEGAVLNSKAEYNRCYVPRLRLVEEQEAIEVEQAEAEELQIVGEELDREDQSWERRKYMDRRSKNEAVGSNKPAEKHRREQGGEARPSKRRKYALIGEGWGAKTTSLNIRNPSSNIRSKDSNDGEEQGAIENRVVEQDDIKVPCNQEDQRHPPVDDPATIPAARSPLEVEEGCDNNPPPQVIPEVQGVPDAHPPTSSTIPDRDGSLDDMKTSDGPDQYIEYGEEEKLGEIPHFPVGGVAVEILRSVEVWEKV